MHYIMHIIPRKVGGGFHVTVSHSKSPDRPIAENPHMDVDTPRECLDIYLTLLQVRAVEVRSIPLDTAHEFHFTIHN